MGSTPTQIAVAPSGVYSYPAWLWAEYKDFVGWSVGTLYTYQPSNLTRVFQVGTAAVALLILAGFARGVTVRGRR